MADDGKSEPLWALFGRFLRFGCLAWGGPIAQIAMIKRELVDEEGWISSSKFNRLLAVYQVLPGPEAHELCVHFGLIRGRRLGGILAGAGFMLPGFVAIILLAWMYRHLDLRNPLVSAPFAGVQVVVLALIVRAVHRIAEHALSSRILLAIALASAALTLLGISFWIVLPACGFLVLLGAPGPRMRSLLIAGASALLLFASWRWAGGTSAPISVAPTTTTVSPGALALFLSGLKGGLLTFGGAYTAIPFIRSDAVGKGWVTDGQFLDGLALSSVIPAPLIIFATFVGYIAGGLAGALAMTAGMFLPAFAFGLVFYEQIDHIIEDDRLHRFLEGVAAGVVGMVGATLLEMADKVARTTPNLWFAAILFVVAWTILHRWKSKWATPVLIGAGAIAGSFLFSGLFIQGHV